MWIVFAIVAVLWIMSIQYTYPAFVTLLFFIALICSATAAMRPSARRAQEQEQPEPSHLERINLRW